MTAGFQAFNASGIYQIDGTTANYQLTQSLTQALAQTSVPTTFNNVGTQFSATYWYTKFTFTANSPLFAFIGSGNVMVTPWRFTQIGSGTYTAEFIGSSACSVTLYVFDNVAPTNNRFGLQVFNAAGTLIADAASPFARIIDVVEGQYMGAVGTSGFDATGSTYPGVQTQQRAYGRNVAIAGCFPAHYMLTSGGGSGDPTSMTGISVSGGVVTWEFHVFAGSSGDHYVGFHESSYYRFMVLDMTGII